MCAVYGRSIYSADQGCDALTRESWREGSQSEPSIGRTAK